MAHDIDTLILPIKAQWFDMIASGKKKEEYRKILDTAVMLRWSPAYTWTLL